MTSVVIHAMPLRFTDPDSVVVHPDAVRILTANGWRAPQGEGADKSGSHHLYRKRGVQHCLECDFRGEEGE